jgi:CxxC motif-containing protein (DUF1111 family)
VPVLPAGYAIPSAPSAAAGPGVYRRAPAYLGPEEADQCDGVARPEDSRTQPLMGMQYLDMFMQHGLAETIEEAIQRHGGECSTARDRFFGLSPDDQAALVAFVSGL